MVHTESCTSPPPVLSRVYVLQVALSAASRCGATALRCGYGSAHRLRGDDDVVMVADEDRELAVTASRRANVGLSRQCPFSAGRQRRH
jgi:hypothetical protein